MGGTTVIRSAANPVWKRIRDAGRGRVGEELLLEGERLIEDARRSGLALEVLVVDEERADLVQRWESAGLEVRTAAAHLVARASELDTPPGCLAVARRPAPLPLAELSTRGRLLLVVAGVADPGNLGALARSAEAAGAAGLVLVRGGASPWRVRALRGSMGSLLRLPVSEVDDAASAASELARAGFRQALAATRGGASLERFDWSGRVALWVGGETGDELCGLRELEPVTIPMAGAVESLNVAAAATLLLFAAARGQRGPDGGGA
jgi:TrmH family RNA methyltransferase